MSVLQSLPRKGSVSTTAGSPGFFETSRSRPELTPDEVEDRVTGDIEMNQSFSAEGGRRRAETLIYSEDSGGTFSGTKANAWYYNFNKYFVAVVISILDKIKFYLKITPAIVVLLALGGQAKSSTVILGLSTENWIVFLAHVICINAIVSVGEIVVFLTLEILLSSYYDEVYCYRGIQGPLGHMLTIGILVNFFDHLELPHLGIPWGSIVTMLVTVLVFYAMKSFHLRKYYLSVLKTRLEPKLEALAKKRSILSFLASTVRLSNNHPLPRPAAPTPMPPLTRKDSMESDITAADNLFSNLNDAFRQIVKEAKHEVEKDTPPEEDEEEPMTYWASLNARHRSLLLQGTMVLSTVSGEIIVRDKKGAMKFGKQLYSYLSKNGTIPVTSNLVCNAIRSSPMILPDKVETTVNATLELFRCSEEADDVIISEQQLASSVKYVYRSMKYAAGSFSDLQELNQAVLVIVDVVFWIAMFLVAQLIVQLDATTILAPILTILFGASFAFASMLSNMLTAVTFVLFVCPYDVGHRVILGYGTGQYAKGNILTVNLFYTTMITNYNEKLVIPNHVLFNERIMNLEESKYATFDLQIAFCADGPHAVPQHVIDAYFRRIKHHMMVEKKGEWKDVDFYCLGLDVPKNILQYSVWVSHEGGWGEVSRTLNARTALYEYLRTLKREMKIEYMQLAEMRQVSTSATTPGFQGFLGSSAAPRNASNRSNSEGERRMSDASPPAAARPHSRSESPVDTLKVAFHADTADV